MTAYEGGRLLRYHQIFLAGAFLGLPFLASLQIDTFGALGREGSFYPLFLGMVIWIIYAVTRREQIIIPRSNSLLCFLTFLLVALSSGLVNGFTLSNLYFQGINGMNRFLIQMGTLIFYFFSALYVCNVATRLRKDPLRLFEQLVLLSFIFPAIYSFFEVLGLWGDPFSSSVVEMINNIFRSNDALYNRVRSVATEPSAFGMYCALLFPWLLLSIFRHNGVKKVFFVIIALYMLLLNILTISRTAYFILGVEAILYFLFLGRGLIRSWKTILVMIIMGVVAFSLVLSEWDRIFSVDIARVYFSLIGDDELYTLSNIARFGTTSAALEIWTHYPILGVGLGGYAFYAPDYYPDWSWISVEIVQWSTNSLSNGIWPVVHNLYARMLAEMGGMGLISWIALNLLLLREEYVLMRLGADSMYVKTIMISTIGIMLCGFNADIFHLFGFWIIIGVTWACGIRRAAEKELPVCLK